MHISQSKVAELSSASGVDAEHLLTLARQSTQPAFQRLYRDVWNMAVDGRIQAQSNERKIALDILRRLASNVEFRVRVELANELAKNPGAPKDLVLMLSDSSIEMAAPILKYSPVLQDEDLIDLIERSVVEHQMAIAARENIGDGVSDALAAKGYTEVIETLLNNHTARISPKLMRTLVAKSKTVENFRRPLVMRPDLPVALATEMYAWVGKALRAVIVCQFDIDPAELDRKLSTVVKKGVAKLHSGALADERGEGNGNGRSPAKEAHRAAGNAIAKGYSAGDHDAPEAQLIEKLYGAGQIAPAFLLRSLREGQIKLFEHALGKLADLPVEVVRQAIRQPDDETLASICAALSLDRMAYMSILQLTRNQRGDLGLRSKSAELQEKYQALSPSDAKATLQLWRQNPQAMLG